MAHTLSNRGRDTYDMYNFLVKYFNKYKRNQYDPVTNKTGILNLGTAESNLCSDIISQKFQEKDLLKWTRDFQFYFIYAGNPGFREALATFVEERFNSHSKINPKDLSVLTGSGTVLETLAFLLADDGEYFLGPTPMYSGVFTDIAAKARTYIYPIPLTSKLEVGETKPFQFSLIRVKKAYQEAMEKGISIRGIILLNPSNPLGTVVDKKDVIDVLNFAAEHKLHVISDEVYALSIIDDSVKHCSVLSLPNLPDPERTHFVWSFSKDFGLSGLRCGVLHSLNKVVNSAIADQFAYFCALPSLVQDMLTKIILDKEWLDTVYFPTNIQRMKEHHDYIASRIEKLGIPVLRCQAAFFLWVQFGKLYSDNCTREQEMEFFERLVDLEGGGLYIVPGTEFRCSEPGWFRVVFSMDKTLLDVACTRIEKLVNSIRCEAIIEDMKIPALLESASVSQPSQDKKQSPASLEGLLTALTSQIRDSNWLKDNTAERWQSENPELASEWKKAIENDNAV